VTEAEKLLHTIFEAGDIIEFRSVRPAGAGKVHEWSIFGEPMTGALRRLRYANDTDHAFFGANPRKSVGGSRASDVRFARSVFVDFDRSASGDAGCSVAEATHRIRDAMLPPPTAIVSTGSGCHAYWRLDEPIGDLDLWTRTQRALIRLLRTDASIHDPPRCMRLPGFANTKYAHRPVAELIIADAARVYSNADLPEPVDARVAVAAGQVAIGSASELARRYFNEGYVLPAGRRATVFAIACDLHARGWDLATAEAAIMHRAERLDLTADEIADLPRQIANAFAKHREPILDEPVQVIPAGSHQAAEDAAGQAAAPPEGRTLTLRQAIALWRDRGDEATIQIDGMFEQLLPRGLPVGQIACIAAAPGVGKTALCLQMVAEALRGDSALHAVWAMGEMTADRLAERIIACQGRVALESVRDKTPDAMRIAEHVDEAIGDRLTIVPDPLLVADIDAAVEASGARICAVDYLQLCRVSRKNLDRRQEVDAVVRELRSMAMRRNIALLLITNMAKGVTHMEHPDAIDVAKESSEIAYQVDLMLYGAKVEDAAYEGLVEWQCLKNRHGPMINLHTRFDGQIQRFAFSAQGQG
jgi:KaiC/GvpD/RAD55 family RecA-like ATPase